MINIYNWICKNLEILNIKIDIWCLIITILEIKIDNEFKPHTRIFYLFDIRILPRIFCMTIFGLGIDLDFSKEGWHISFEWLGVYFWSSDRELQKEITVLRNL